MMKSKMFGMAVAAGTLGVTSDASAALQNYYTKYPVVEMNGSQGAGAIHSMLAGGLMGAKGFGNVVIDGNDEAELLAKCQGYTPDSTTWPNGCDLAGFVAAMKAQFPGQNWVKSVYDGTDVGKQSAVNQQLYGLFKYGSPSVIPLYGQVDHWGTMVRMYADMAVNPWVISKVWFYDAGDPLFVEDVEFNMYDDGLKAYSGAVYKTTYYLVFAPKSISPNDTFYGKHVFAYEPPLNALQFDPKKNELHFAPGTPVLGEGERMSAGLASELVWDALDLEGLLDDPTYRQIADEGIAGRGWEVHGFTPTGTPWNYFVVPIYDADMRGVLALVGLSAEDGAFEQIRTFRASKPIAFRTARDAGAAARGLLRGGESLVGGKLTWDPRCDDSYCRSPELPYFEYTIRGPNKKAVGRAVVPIQGGSALRR